MLAWKVQLAIPEPWRGTVEASLSLIDDLDAEIDLVNRKLRLSGAQHPYIPLLLTVPGIGCVLAFTIASPPVRRAPRRSA
jgi:transposase